MVNDHHIKIESAKGRLLIRCCDRTILCIHSHLIQQSDRVACCRKTSGLRLPLTGHGDLLNRDICCSAANVNHKRQQFVIIFLAIIKQLRCFFFILQLRIKIAEQCRNRLLKRHNRPESALLCRLFDAGCRKNAERRRLCHTDSSRIERLTELLLRAFAAVP